MASSWAMPLSDLGRNSDQFDDHYIYDEHGNDDDDDVQKSHPASVS